MVIRGSFLCRLPVKTLQLEQIAVLGSAEEPSVVASRMRLVFSTLEVSQTRKTVLEFFNVISSERKYITSH